MDAVDDALLKRRRATAERVRRFKRRRRERAVFFKVEVDGTDIDALVRVSVLDEAQRHDPSAVKGAVLRLSSEAYRAPKGGARQSAAACAGGRPCQAVRRVL